MDFEESPHRRFNPLTGEWILVSPHRTKRPWQGKVEDIPAGFSEITYDAGCYLCPGNIRSSGIRNPRYNKTFVFVNDFSAILSDIADYEFYNDDLFKAVSEKGICKVICFSPFHNQTLAIMDEKLIVKVVKTWIAEYLDLGSHSFINYVQIFENRGDIMGCSNPHPHGQIWSNQSLPVVPRKEDFHQRMYYEKKHSCLLCDYLKREVKYKERIIFENDSFTALVPFWAVWPFETMILPKSHKNSIDQLNEKEVSDLAGAIQLMGIKFDNLFSISFPYSMGIHQQPTNQQKNDHWHFHLHYLPPLLRSATIQKYMVGYELLANPQRDITAEKSAQRLKELSDVHFYKQMGQEQPVGVLEEY